MATIIPALKAKSETKHRSYTRTEESRYVYLANPGGEGGTVGATNVGSFSFRSSEGGHPPTEKSGSHAGMFGGEVDSSGNIMKGATQHIVREGDQMKQDIKGDTDPSEFIRRVGLKKPEILKNQPFDKTAIKQNLKPTMTEVLDDFRCDCEFTGDPLTHRTPLSAVKGQ